MVKYEILLTSYVARPTTILPMTARIRCESRGSVKDDVHIGQRAFDGGVRVFCP